MEFAPDPDDVPGAPRPAAPRPGRPTFAAPAAVPTAGDDDVVPKEMARAAEDRPARLAREWRLLQRSFAYHPVVRIAPLKDDPPTEYRVDYRPLRTLVVTDDGQLDYAPQCSVHVWLPPGFPDDPPLVRPVQAIFHPNVTMDYILLAPPWTAASTVADVVTGIGQMLAFQAYDHAQAYNEMAVQWMADNPGLLPVDAAADLRVEAGGEPLERLCRYGPRTLEQIRGQLGEMAGALAGPDEPPAGQDVGQFCAQSRRALSLFLGADVPAEVRGPAEDLEGWARGMSEAVVLWETVRRYDAAAVAADAAARHVAETRQVLVNAMRELDQAARHAGDPPADPVEALKRIPPPGTLHHHQAALSSLATRARQELAALDERLRAFERLAKIPAPAATLPQALASRASAERQRALETAVAARDAALVERGLVKPALRTAEARLAGLARAIAWREYADQFDKAAEVARKATGWGAAGVEAYFIDNAAGRFGPFDLEQRLTLGEVDVAVRSPDGDAIEVLDAGTGDVLARSDRGFTTLVTPDPASGQNRTTGFRLTAGCDEMAVQLEYLVAQTRDALASMAAQVDAGGETWLTAYDRALTAPAARAALASRQADAEGQWDALGADLAALAPFKRRVAAYSLLLRASAAAPRHAAALAGARKRLNAATERIGWIASRSSLEPDTGQLMVPARHGQEYAEQVRKRHEAIEEIAHLEALAGRIAGDLRARLATADQVGAAAVPHLNALAALPDETAALAPAMGNAALTALADLVAGHLRTEIPLPPDLAPDADADAEPSPEADEEPSPDDR